MNPSAHGNGRDIILQAFHWNLVKTQRTGTVDGAQRSWYAILKGMVDEIAEVGFTIVYLPPPWRDDSAWEAGGKHGGGEGYFWRDFELDTRYGTKAELTRLISALHARGLKVIVDLVPNHRDRLRMKADQWPYPGPCWRHGGHDTGGGFLDGSFDLALDNPAVYGRIRQALNVLTDECGVDGWRWDFVWGYGVEHVVSWIRDTTKIEYFCMGEYWQASADRTEDPMVQKYGHNERDRIIGWAQDSGCCAFDILLKREIQTADPANLKYGLNATGNDHERALMVTYVDNHDTGASPYSPANGWGQKHWECCPDFKSQAYAYILTMPGTPCVYWPDCFDWGMKDQIAALIAARKRAGIVAPSRWDDLTGSHYGFAATVRDGQGAASLAVSIGSNYCGPGTGWTTAAEDPGRWTVWLPTADE